MDDEISPGTAGLIFALVVGLIGVVVWLVMFMAGWKAVPVDKYALHYTGGPVQGTHFKEVVQPGTHTKFYGLLEHLYQLPSTQRTYIISKDPAAGDVSGQDFLSAPSSDNVPFTFEAAVYFKLNSDPKVIRRFFEQICLHDNCTDLSKHGGWDKMLAQYFRPQVESAMRLEAERFDREHLWHDPATLLAIQTSIGPVLKDRINAALGGEYFCGPDSTATNCTTFGFVLKNPSPPQSVVDAYAENAASSQRVLSAQNDARAKAAAAQGDADAQTIRANAQAPSQAQIDYIRAQAEQACATNDKGSCVLVVSGGSGVNVNVGK